jgi:integrase
MINPTTKNGCLYVIEAGDTGIYKIGHGVDANKRARELQVGNPRKLKVKFTSERNTDGVDACRLEQAAHAVLADFRLSGEWFQCPLNKVRLAIKIAFAKLTNPGLYERWSRLSSRRTKIQMISRKDQKPFTKEMVDTLRRVLVAKKCYRDLALFCLQIDSLLRSNELLSLRVGDVSQDGKVRDRFSVVRSNGMRTLSCTISPEARKALTAYLSTFTHDDDDHLFPGNCGGALTIKHYGKLVKDWIVLLRQAGMRHLNPLHYSPSSIRRSKAVFFYGETGDMFTCQQLLHHSAPRTTIEYFDRFERENLSAKFSF